MRFHHPDSLYHIFSQVIKLHYSLVHRELEKVGVYPGQPPLLWALHLEDGQSQKDLATKLNIKPATITMMVKRMEKAGLIERSQDPVDQRVSRVYLTNKGRQVWIQVTKVMQQVDRDCFRGFTEEEQIILRRLFMQMRENLGGLKQWIKEDES